MIAQAVIASAHGHKARSLDHAAVPYLEKSHPNHLEARFFLPEETVPASQTPRLLDQVHAVIRARHLSVRSEKAYVGWIRNGAIWLSRENLRCWSHVAITAIPRAVFQHYSRQSSNLS